ncbi:Protein F58B4.3 a, partial [Aphelenchoides avenae]
MALLPASEALLCYQGEQNASAPVQGRPQDCLASSMSCGVTFNVRANTATRFCQMSNCTINGALTSSPICVNTSSLYCCCYGDGCNTETLNANGEFVHSKNPAAGPEETNLAGSIASRIEDFYEHDAVSAERTFIRR